MWRLLFAAEHSSRATRASVVAAMCGLSSCGSQASGHRLSSHGAQVLRDVFDLLGPGIEPMSLALPGDFLPLSHHQEASVLFCIYPEVAFLIIWPFYFKIFEKAARLFSRVSASFYLPTRSAQGPSVALTNTCYFLPRASLRGDEIVLKVNGVLHPVQVGIGGG